MNEPSLRTLVGQFVETWNTKDIPAFGALFVPDADFVDIVGNLAQGRIGIEQLHKVPFATVLREARLSIESLTLRDLGHDLASGDLRWRNVGSRGMDGTALPDQLGNIFFIARTSGEDALFVSVRNTNYTGGLGRPGGSAR